MNTVCIIKIFFLSIIILIHIISCELNEKPKHSILEFKESLCRVDNSCLVGQIEFYKGYALLTLPAIDGKKTLALLDFDSKYQLDTLYSSGICINDSILELPQMLRLDDEIKHLLSNLPQCN